MSSELKISYSGESSKFAINSSYSTLNDIKLRSSSFNNVKIKLDNTPDNTPVSKRYNVRDFEVQFTPGGVKQGNTSSFWLDPDTRMHEIFEEIKNFKTYLHKTENSDEYLCEQISVINDCVTKIHNTMEVSQYHKHSNNQYENQVLPVNLNIKDILYNYECALNRTESALKKSESTSATQMDLQNINKEVDSMKELSKQVDDSLKNLVDNALRYKILMHKIVNKDSEDFKSQMYKLQTLRNDIDLHEEKLKQYDALLAKVDQQYNSFSGIFNLNKHYKDYIEVDIDSLQNIFTKQELLLKTCNNELDSIDGFESGKNTEIFNDIKTKIAKHYQIMFDNDSKLNKLTTSSEEQVKLLNNFSNKKTLTFNRQYDHAEKCHTRVIAMVKLTKDLKFKASILEKTLSDYMEGRKASNYYQQHISPIIKNITHMLRNMDINIDRIDLKKEGMKSDLKNKHSLLDKIKSECKNIITIHHKINEALQNLRSKSNIQLSQIESIPNKDSDQAKFANEDYKNLLSTITELEEKNNIKSLKVQGIEKEIDVCDDEAELEDLKIALSLQESDLNRIYLKLNQIELLRKNISDFSELTEEINNIKTMTGRSKGKQMYIMSLINVTCGKHEHNSGFKNCKEKHEKNANTIENFQIRIEKLASLDVKKSTAKDRIEFKCGHSFKLSEYIRLLCNQIDENKLRLKGHLICYTCKEPIGVKNLSPILEEMLKLNDRSYHAKFFQWAKHFHQTEISHLPSYLTKVAPLQAHKIFIQQFEKHVGWDSVDVLNTQQFHQAKALWEAKKNKRSSVLEID